MKIQIYKSTIFGTIGLLMLTSYSCNGTKNTSKPNTNQEQVSIEKKESLKFETTFDMSARTKLFLNSVEDEITSKGNNIDNFEPSPEIIENYGLKKRGELYIIRGFIKTTPDFTKNDLESKGVSFGRKVGEMMTISFPLNFLQQFLTTENITYFEISEQVSPK